MENRAFNKRFSSMFVVGRNIGQVIPSGAWTVVQWDNETYDELDEITIINPWSFIPKLTGYYYFNTHCRINDLNVGDIFWLYFYLNGANNITGASGEATNLNEDISLSIAGIRLLTPIDNIRVVVWHNFGAGRTIQGNQWETNFSGYRIR